MHDIGRDTSSASDHDMSDGTWMTYADLATLREINHASAFKLALRHKWRRQKNNMGQMTVFVPSAWLDPSQDNARDVSHRTEAFQAALAAIREAHAGETAALREQLAAADQERAGIRSERDQERARADRAEAGREAEREHAVRAEHGRDSERARADSLRDRLAAAEIAVEQACRQAQAAQDNAETLRGADIERRGRGRLARLKAAWRGE